MTYHTDRDHALSLDTQIGSFRKAVQEAFAPELGEIKADLLALHREVILRFEVTQKQLDQRFSAEREHTDQLFDHIDQRFDAEREHADQRFTTSTSDSTLSDGRTSFVYRR